MAGRARPDRASYPAPTPCSPPQRNPPRKPRLHTPLTAAPRALTTLFTTGCERALFGYANRGLPPPEATVAFAPDLGLSLDLYRPQGNPTPPAPTVLFFYGGGWQRGQRGQYRFVGRQLAQQGVLAIVADYRTFPRAGFPDFEL
ncbi:MAG: hypothetical protein ACYC42_06140, partial [Lysobacter sp.]